MSTHEQIEGELPLYALGALDEDALHAVENHLEGCAVCRGELLRLRGDLGLVGLSVRVAEPPAYSRARLLRAVAREPRSLRGKSALTWAAVFALASVVLLAVSLILWRQNENLQNEGARLRTQIEQERSSTALARQVMAVMTAPDAMHVTLVAGKVKRQPQGRAIYSPHSGGLVFLASDFEELKPGKAYELWLLPADSRAPIPAGVFKPDDKGSALVLMPQLASGTVAKAFAVTVEPESGSTTPTPPILLSGGQ